MSSITVSPKTRQLQLQLVLVFSFLMLSLFCLSCWIHAAQYALFGATAQASVVDVQGDYDSRGARLPYRKIDYQYFDDQAKVVRHGSHYFPFTSSTPAVGETFAVEYLPNHDNSSYVPDDDHSPGQLGMTIPAFMLILVLAGLFAWSVRHGEWIF